MGFTPWIFPFAGSNKNKRSYLISFLKITVYVNWMFCCPWLQIEFANSLRLYLYLTIPWIIKSNCLRESQLCEMIVSNIKLTLTMSYNDSKIFIFIIILRINISVQVQLQRCNWNKCLHIYIFVIIIALATIKVLFCDIYWINNQKV